MTTIACFVDNSILAQNLQQMLFGYDVHIFSASELNFQVRDQVQQLSPDIVLMEVTRAMENAHLYFFLRADEYTRATPVILISLSNHVAYQASVLEANGFLQAPFSSEQLYETLDRYVAPQYVTVAA